MLKNNCTLPPAAHFIVRYHSFYALHRDDAYGYLLDEEDARHLAWLKEFK
jgi:inositol oxygenase